MDYALLLPTVGCGVGGTLAIRASQGLRRTRPLLVAIAFFVLATIGLSRLVQELPVGVVYAVWAGLASATLLAVDFLVFHEPLRRLHAVGLVVVVAGVVLLNSAVPR